MAPIWLDEVDLGEVDGSCTEATDCNCLALEGS